VGTRLLHTRIGRLLAGTRLVGFGLQLGDLGGQLVNLDARGLGCCCYCSGGLGLGFGLEGL
jgi:hypothetical protein